MDLRHLNAYVAVAEELHFSRAARRLFMSQSALSRLVRVLETELGVVLLDRSTRHVSLTPAGTSFLREARLALGQVDLAVQAAQAAGGRETNILRVGYCDATEVVLADTLQAFRLRCPDVALSVQEVDRNSLNGTIWAQGDEWDVALCRSPVDGSHTRSVHVRDEPLCVSLPLAHPLAAQRSVALGELTGDAPLVVLPTGLLPAVRAALMQGPHRGSRATAEQNVPTFAAAAVLVSAGLCITIVPSSMCATLGLPGVVCRPLTGEGMVAPLYAIRRQPETSAHVTALIDALGETAPSVNDDGAAATNVTPA